MLVLQELSYIHPNKELLFERVQLTVNDRDKTAIVGNNGSGKSSLLRMIAGELQPTSGHLAGKVKPYYVPQLFGQYNQLTIAEALQVDKKLQALREILNGTVTGDNMTVLEEDWMIEERCMEALTYWGLEKPVLTQKLETLSGGQKTKIFLAGISIHQPEFILLDEPSNHLDHESRQQLYDLIRNYTGTMIVVSHDRTLLNLLDRVCELKKNGITAYGGNYDFYVAQKQIEGDALHQDIHSTEKALRKAKQKERETAERQQKLDARGKGKQEKAGVARIMMNTLRNNAENSTSRIKNAHTEKITGISQELQQLRSAVPDAGRMKLGFDNSSLHEGKILFMANELNFKYDEQVLWFENLNLQINSGERIALKGKNGSGKTTLIKLILGTLEAQSGTIHRPPIRSVYIDQDYSLLDRDLTVYEQAQRFNQTALQEHEVRIRLTRFLFTLHDWDKKCGALSGGERMRLALCCLSMHSHSPDIIVLDEPTNNLDIQNIEILTKAINDYQGTLITVSHDLYFLEQINITRTINLMQN
ncbi:MAG TPA: ABC-F family ATP-binding cassette domain-containing protein [Flavipsychrobacter sp.]|nr:ABC-F family ATP-binding cassette domain-containing protein [Flavipsychrobacter sp.]